MCESKTEKLFLSDMEKKSKPIAKPAVKRTAKKVAKKKATAKKVAAKKPPVNPAVGRNEFFYLGISSEAKRIFDHIAALYPDKVDVDLDFATLAIFAENTVRLRHLYQSSHGISPVTQKTRETKEGEVVPAGNPYLNPLMTAISMCEKQINQASAKLGLTPDARRKIAIDLAELEAKQRGRRVQRKNLKPESEDDFEEEFA